MGEEAKKREDWWEIESKMWEWEKRKSGRGSAERKGGRSLCYSAVKLYHKMPKTCGKASMLEGT